MVLYVKEEIISKAFVVFGHAMLQTQLASALGAGVSVQFGQFGPALGALANRNHHHIGLVVSLAVHGFMDAEVFLHCQVGVDFDGFVAEGTDVHLFVLFFVGWATMRFNGGVVCAEDLVAVLALDGEPIFLFACVD